MTTQTERIEQVARNLREQAFPGASAWAFCSEDVRERWIKAAEYAESRVELAVDTALRKATAAAHELKQHEAAKMLRQMRNGGECAPVKGE